MDSAKLELPTSSQAAVAPSSSSKQDFPNYTLSAILEAHQQCDAKCVSEINGIGLVSGGRDGIMKLWKKISGFYENTLSIPQKDCLAINSVAVGALGDDCLIFLGRKNGSIAIFSAQNEFAEPIKILQIHKSNVCALYFDQSTGILMSGSWDHNAIVWPIFDLLREEDTQVGLGLLSGHSCSVWAVSTVPMEKDNTHFLTGSADKTILLWGPDFEQRRLFQGHTDVVRAIVVLSSQFFISSSNDSSIRLWTFTSGLVLRTFYPSHQEFIYTMTMVDCSPVGPLIITGGEGGTIDIFALKDNVRLEHRQALKMPVHSVWCVAPLSNGDFAVATSSGLILTFTCDEERKAPDDIQEFFFSSQYEALEARNREMQKAKDEHSIGTLNGAADENGVGLWRRIGDGTMPFESSSTANAAYHDPFTGSNRYVPGNNINNTGHLIEKKRSPIVPLPDELCSFGLDGVSKKVLDKLREMNMLQPNELKMTDDEMCSAEQILTEQDFPINECQIMALEKGILWSAMTIVPVLDIFRIALLHPQLNEIFCSLTPVLGNPPKGASTIQRLIYLLKLDESPDPVRILVCRSLANAASHEFGRSMLLTETTALWDAIIRQFGSSKAALQIAASAALLNLTRVLLEAAARKEIVELGPREDALHVIIESLSTIGSFDELFPLALIRLLQTLIVLLGRGGAAGSTVACCLRIEELQVLAETMKRIKDAVTDDDVKALARELSEIIGAL